MPENNLRNQMNNKKLPDDKKVLHGIANRELVDPMSTKPLSAFEPAELPSPEQVQERPQDKQQLSTVTAAATSLTEKNPVQAGPSWNQAWNKIQAVSSSLSPEEQDDFQKRAEKINRAREQAEQEYKKTKDLNQWLSVAETLGHALTQLGAGAYGLKHNIDMSGLKFNKTDWAKNIDRAAEELDRKLGLTEKQERGVTREKERLEDKKEKLADFEKRAMLKDYFARQQQALDREKMYARLTEQAAKQDKDTKASDTQRKELRSFAQRAANQARRELKALDLAVAAAQAGDEDKMRKALTAEQAAGTTEAMKKGEWWGTDIDKAVPYLEQLRKTKQAEVDSWRQRELNLIQNQTGPEQEPAPAPARKPGTVLMYDTEGNVREVPASQKNDALAAGYKLAE